MLLPCVPTLLRIQTKMNAKIFAAFFILLLIPLSSFGTEEEILFIDSNRQWDLLSDSFNSNQRAMLREAGDKLGDWKIDFAGLVLSGTTLKQLGNTAKSEPLLRAVREKLGRPIDLKDFLFFLDDVLVAGKMGLRGKTIFVPSGRARNAGILVHPDDVFKNNKPRLYGVKEKLLIAKPKPQKELIPAQDGDPLGERWAARFQNPSEQEEIIDALKKSTPDFAKRIESLVTQLKEQGAQVYYMSSLRYRERGYLMYGAFALAKSKDNKQAQENVERLDLLNRKWGLNIPIQWQHPEGWEKTIEEAQLMRDTYGVVYATEKGARSSLHYDGIAIDFTALALPRKLILKAPDGSKKTFDLSAVNETRDISLTSDLIKWIEKHFDFYKLLSDYPHWTDAKALRERK